MLNHLSFAHARNRAALAAGIAAVVLTMSACGSDDDTATQSQGASSGAATTSASTSADSAPAAASTSADPAPAAASSTAPPSKPTARNCPVTAKELSQQIGVKLHASRPLFSTKVTCAFNPVDDCPCGSAKYPEAIVIIAAGLPQSVAEQRASNKAFVSSGPGGTKLIDRPDFGKDAFVIQAAGQRGRGAVFPSPDGPATVSVSFGIPDKASQARAAQDARVSNRVLAFVAHRMS